MKNLQQCLKDRFDDFQSQKLAFLKFLDVGAWPGELEGLREFGNVCLDAFWDRFNALLHIHKPAADDDENVDDLLSDLKNEWHTFSSFYKGNLRHLSRQDLWRNFLVFYKKTFPLLAIAVEILLLLPASNASLERGFSTMGRIKGDDRNRLGHDILDHLLRIKIDGPSLDKFNPDGCTQRFFSTRRNPGAKPYGPRSKRPKVVAEIDSTSISSESSDSE